jgi:uncharacterized membrane protein YhaH (DUF805 family)
MAVSPRNTSSTRVAPNQSRTDAMMRIGRLAYLAWYGYFFLTALGLVVIMFALALLQHLTTIRLINDVIGVIFAVIVVTYFCLAVYSYTFTGVRRLHDLQHSGRWFYLSLVPGIAVIITLYLLLIPGTDGPNAYGDPIRSYRFLDVLGLRRRNH